MNTADIDRIRKVLPSNFPPSAQYPLPHHDHKRCVAEVLEEGGFVARCYRQGVITDFTKLLRLGEETGPLDGHHIFTLTYFGSIALDIYGATEIIKSYGDFKYVARGRKAKQLIRQALREWLKLKRPLVVVRDESAETIFQ